MLRPITRVLVGIIAIPIFRFVMRRVFRLQEMDDELEKDLEEWFRGALLLLAASANMEHLLFGWMQKVDWLDRADWLTMGLRLMLAISVIEAMPDQELFAVLHPGPPKLEKGKNVLVQFWQKKWKFLKGIFCRHLNRSSPVLAMMCAIVGSRLATLPENFDDLYRHEFMAGLAYCERCSFASPLQTAITVETLNEILPDLTLEADILQRHRERWIVGWVCYVMAITQYLIIGLVTSRDRALDVLSTFDRAVAERRRELIEEFKLEGNLPEDFSAEATESSESAPEIADANDAVDEISSKPEVTSPFDDKPRRFSPRDGEGSASAY